jgi:soluble lytic murein transglycosylase-like protein
MAAISGKSCRRFSNENDADSFRQRHRSHFSTLINMTRLAALLPGFLMLAFLSSPANAQAGATPPAAHNSRGRQGDATLASTGQSPSPTANGICLTLEQAAAQNSLPVGFFARVIWQERRYNARAVSRKGAEGIAQFMPQTADWRGLANPFDLIEALYNSASYLRELRNRFGNLGLAAAGYNAGPGRVSAWRGGRARLAE